MDDAAIIEAVASEHETVAVDENEDPDASDSEEGVVEHDGDETRQAREEEIIKTSTEFLRSISQQKAYILHNKLPKSLLKELSNIENVIVASKAKSCNTQTNLFKFFPSLTLADYGQYKQWPILASIVFYQIYMYCIIFIHCTNKKLKTI